MNNVQKLIMSILFMNLGIHTNLWVDSSTILNRSEKLDIVELRIDPNYSTLIDSSNNAISTQTFLQLETNKNCEISYISKLQVSSNNFYILDENLNNLFIFNKNGKFLNKVNNNRKIDVKNIHSFSVSDSQNLLKINDSHSPYFYYFDLEGNFIKKEEKVNYDELDFTLTDYGEIIYKSFPSKEESPSSSENSFLSLKYLTNGTVKNIFPNELKGIYSEDIYETRNHFYSNTPNRPTFVMPYDYSVYEIDSLGTILERFKFIFPISNTIPKDFLIDEKYKGNRQNYLSNNNSIIYSFEDVYYNQNWITFNVINYGALLLNLQTLQLFSLDKSKIRYNDVSINLNYSRVLAMENDQIITAIYPNSIVSELKKANKKLFDSMPKELQNLKTSGFQNPILIFSKLN